MPSIAQGWLAVATGMALLSSLPNGSALAAVPMPGSGPEKCMVVQAIPGDDPAGWLYFADPVSKVVTIVGAEAYRTGVVQPEDWRGAKLHPVKQQIKRLSGSLKTAQPGTSEAYQASALIKDLRALDGSGVDGAWRTLIKWGCNVVDQAMFQQAFPTYQGNDPPFYSIEVCVATLTLGGTYHGAAVAFCNSIVGQDPTTPTEICDPGKGGVYYELITSLDSPADQESYGDCYDFGSWWATRSNGKRIPAGYWRYAYPKWYVWRCHRDAGCY